ncbi:MAG: helicase-associated domain-containing protein, partial [Jatrophihabitans sp.]
MAASPAPPPDGARAQPRASTLTLWLRARTDRDLATLLRLRPDLALPAPPDITALASRLAVRTSVQRAVDALDAYELRALENLVLAAGADDTVEDPETDGLDALFDRTLVWGEPDLVHVIPAARDALGTYPAGLGRPAGLLLRQVSDVHLAPVLRHAGLPPTAQPVAGSALADLLADPEWVAARLSDCDDDERAVLEQLAAGPPVGTVRNTRLAATDSDLAAPLRLINRGLLIPVDTQRVELPREVGLVLRAAAAPPSAEAPAMRLIQRQPADLDRLGTSAALESLRLVEALADSWTASAPSVLRSGGLGVRELKRTARDLGVDEATAALIVEISFAAGLLNATNGIEPVFLPTAEYDLWRSREPAARWIALATSWTAMTRQPSLVGLRGERDRVITALGPDAERGTVPVLRRQVLDVLSSITPGAAPAERADVLTRLAWQQPRRAAAQQRLVEAVLAEADLLGVTAAGGLTGYSRTLFAGSVAAAEHALDRALPDPVDHFLVQPDLTIVVPGPPEPSMGVELALIADLESTGGASVFRITEASVRRAMDAGRSGHALASFVASRSRTPVPQALSYMIDDAARRHGVLRTGTASAYVRCADESLLARIVADRATAALGLRLLAPTVLISQAPVTTVLEVLRNGGFAPAAESPDGDLITIGAEPPRAGLRPVSRVAMSTRGVVDADARAMEIVRRIRSNDALAGMDSRVQTIVSQVPG